MTDGDALAMERACSVVACSLSDGRREGVRLMSGDERAFGLNGVRTMVNVPYPAPVPDWTPRTLTCGIALQCSPSKDRLATLNLAALSGRDLRALAVVEGAVALGWARDRWPGLGREFSRVLGDVEAAPPDTDAPAMVDRALALARSRTDPRPHPLLGAVPVPLSGRGFGATAMKIYGRMPWSDKRRLSRGKHTIPGGGDGGVQNPNLPPPSRPEDEWIEPSSTERAGIPYPEWNFWEERFLADHVAVLERKHSTAGGGSPVDSLRLNRWFSEHTHRMMRGGLEDGTDLDVDRYIDYWTTTRTGGHVEPRVFRDLLPGARDVTTALLLDGSSSLGVHQGQVFRLELACADALSRAMTATRERHGLFVFSGNTRHRVDVLCLKDFGDRRLVVPGDLGLAVGGYTRLGAPVRHLTSRLLRQPSERRLMIIIGDGLMSDEGYEGRYAWADVAHALAEADEAGVSVYYIGIGPVRVDPLPEVFGPRRSQRIRRLEDLPRALAHVHRELLAA
jgi:nitric oxide reductase NorD protein